MAALNLIRRLAVVVVLSSAPLFTSGCTAVIGASLRYATATSPSTETYVVDGEASLVLARVNGWMRGGDTVTASSSTTLVADISEQTYRYAVSVARAPSQPGKSLLQMKVEMIGDWEQRGWYSCKDESHAFMKCYTEKTGSAAVLVSAK